MKVVVISYKSYSGLDVLAFALVFISYMPSTIFTSLTVHQHIIYGVQTTLMMKSVRFQYFPTMYPLYFEMVIHNFLSFPHYKGCMAYHWRCNYVRHEISYDCFNITNLHHSV